MPINIILALLNPSTNGFAEPVVPIMLFLTMSRSTPPNPRTNTNCPWNISTIEADQFRKVLEIGS